MYLNYYIYITAHHALRTETEKTMKNLDNLQAYATETADQNVGGASYASLFMAPGPVAHQNGFQSISMAPGPVHGLQGVRKAAPARSPFFARSSRNASLGPFR